MAAGFRQHSAFTFRSQLHSRRNPSPEATVTAEWADFSLVPCFVLMLPIILTLFYRWTSLRRCESEREPIWHAYRMFRRFILAITVAVWWAVWDSHGGFNLVSIIERRWPGSIGLSGAKPLLFWLLPTVSLGVFLVLCNRTDKRILKLKWSVGATLRQVGWKLVSFVIPLLMVAAGFGNILAGKARGLAWLFAAGVISRIGTVFLRLSEGFKLNALKGGDIRSRAISSARRMGVTLETVYVVPAGKGHLTNAYGMSKAIALTDNLGKYLTKTEIEYVIAHELAHVKLKHGRKHLFLVVSIFLVTALVLYGLSHRMTPFKPLIQLLAIMSPLGALYYCSRRFEYFADDEAVDFTGDPEAAIRALINLHQIKELNPAYNTLAEMFTTHPTLLHRLRAVASRGHVSADRLTELMREGAGIHLT